MFIVLYDDIPEHKDEWYPLQQTLCIDDIEEPKGPPNTDTFTYVPTGWYERCGDEEWAEISIPEITACWFPGLWLYDTYRGYRSE